MLKPKANAPLSLQPGEIVAVKVKSEWVKAKLFDVDRTQYKDSSFL